MTHYAVIERKSAPLASDFARDFMTRRWGETFTAALYDRMPRYQRGKHKGEIKGRLFWDKCTKGGWKRTGPSYHGSPNGHVVTPGSSNLRVTLLFDCQHDQGMSPDNWPSSLTDEQKIEFLDRGIADLIRQEKISRGNRWA